MLKPICVPCQRFFRMKKSGYYFIEGMPVGSTRPKEGTAEPEKWQPYKCWSGDLWECKGCGAQIVSGVGMAPMSEHYKDDWRTVLASTGAKQLQVNDC